MTVRLLILVVAGLTLTGCEGGLFGPDRSAEAPARTDQVFLTIEMPARVTVGQPVDVDVLVTNPTEEPFHVVSPTGALVVLKLKRLEPIGWVPVRQFPDMALQALRPWTIDPGQTRPFSFNLTVEPDWPANEALRMVATLNGTQIVSDPASVWVSAPRSSQ